MKKPGRLTLRAAVFGAALAAGACAGRPPGPPPATAPAPPPPGALRVRVDARVASVPLEEYVAGCVAAELGSVSVAPDAAARARDVQAILCRSFALGGLRRHAREGFDLCSTSHCQVYRPVPASAVGRLSREAANRTAGRVLKAGGRPVVPVYHADCGGHTSAGHDVWGGPPVSYLVARKDDVCPTKPEWRFEIAIDRLAGALKDAPGLEIDGLRDLQIDRRDPAGRAASLRLVGREPRIVRGNDLRTAVVSAFGASSLRSTLFSVARRGRLLVFDGRGGGHGAGVCQAGMVARAARGDRPAAILAHYLPGTVVGPW